MFLKRSLSETLSVYSSEHFPWRNKQTLPHRHTVVVGVGGNVGDVRRRFEHLFFEIQRDKRVTLTQTSLILKNPPFGFTEQEDFFNTTVVIKTSMNARTFLEYLMRLEKKFGRKRIFSNAPRTLDLDIIFFDDLVMDTKKLTLPHPAWMERESVLIPLSGLRL